MGSLTTVQPLCRLSSRSFVVPAPAGNAQRRHHRACTAAAQRTRSPPTEVETRQQQAPVVAQQQQHHQGGQAGRQEAASATRRRVVLAVDASEDSISAFRWVLANLLRPQDELHLLHVVPDVFTSPASGSVYYCSSPDPETERLLWQQAKQFFVDNFIEHAKGMGLEDAVSLHLVKESRGRHIGKAVCKKAEELGAEPLVLAAHDKGWAEQLLVGSVSKYCVAHSKRPVLLLHPTHSHL